MAKPRILIVEDETIVARDIGEQLTEQGYEPVGFCIRGEEILEAAKTKQADLVLMDIHLAGEMDGIEAAGLIREQLDVPVVFLTAFGEKETFDRAKESDPYGYIVKPFNPSELRTVIEIALFKHQSGARLRESEKLWKFALEGAQDGVWDLDFPTQKIVSSKRLADMLGYALSEIDTDYREFKKLIHPEDIDSAVESLGRYLEDPSSTFQVEHRMLCKDGTYKWILVRGMLVSHDADGQPKRMVGVTTDITERKHMEIQLRKLSNIVEQAPLSIVITDLKGTIEYANPRFAQVTGYTVEEVIGQNPRVLKSGKMPEDLYQDMWETLAQGDVWSGELINRRKNGEIYLENAVISPIKDEQGKTTHYAALKDDITLQKRGEAESAAKLAEEKELTEMKTRFISVTSHEFRTPMAAAMGSVGILVNHLDQLTPEKRTELFGRINNSLNRMTLMLDEILLLNRIDAKRVEVRPASFKLGLFVKDVIEGIRLGDTANHRFEFVDESTVESFVTDTNLLQHVLDNLLSNAVRFSPADSVIAVQLTADGAGLQLTVEDQGIGILPSDRERLFEPFERGSNVGTIKGTGLGLNIVKRMVDLLGGTIALDCPESGGCCFTITIPQSAVD